MTRARYGSWLAAMAMALISVTSSCADGGVNQPPSSTSTTVSDSPPTTRPSITRPLDASAYRDRPCELLTSEQVTARELTLAPEMADRGRTDRAECVWKGKATTRTPTLRVSYYPEDLLGRIYRRDLVSGFFPDDFIPITVAGQPAARSNIPSARELSCFIAIGATESHSVEVWANDIENACDQAMAVAEEVVHNLGG